VQSHHLDGCDSVFGTGFTRSQMWTTEDRHRYDRDRLRYLSDLTNAE
jgi:hypothetical protein